VSTDVSDLAHIANVHPSCTVSDATAEALAQGILRAVDAPAANLRSCIETMSLPIVAERICSIYGAMANANVRSMDENPRAIEQAI
jgi:hypothetical protein